jgi:predicted metalloprotease
MGYVRKITGVQKQIEATQANAAAQERATLQAAKDQQAALAASAKAAADQQSQLAARSAVEATAAAAASAPLASADVQLEQDSPDSVTATRAKRKAAFGRNYGGGVSI